MDASDTGLCVLEPQLQQFLRVEFTTAERRSFATSKRENSINVRELMSAVLAVLHWGPRWQPSGRDRTHVCMWIDNTSAVAWLNNRSSGEPIARTYNRLISVAEFWYSLTCSAAHIAGEQNVMADAGSRAWSDTHPLHSLWTNLSASWTQVQVVPPFDNLLSLWETFSADTQSLFQPPPNTAQAGDNGWSPWLSQPGRSANKKLGCFAVYCWRYGWNRTKQGNTFGTIKLKLASIRWFHRRYCGIDLTISPDFTMLLQGIKRLSPPVHKLQPITPAFLRLLYSRIDFQLPQQRLLWGSVVIGFFFLLRRSEYLRIGQHRHFYCLKYKDVYFSDGEGRPADENTATSVTIGLAGAKNDQFGRGAWRTMHSSGDQIICPVMALKQIYLARRSTSDNSPYLCSDLSRKCPQRNREKHWQANYSTHSVRIGGATALLSGQVSNTAIKLLGRWISNYFEQYPTQAANSTTTLARRMVGSSRRHIHA
ncbi:LOW QUALITY PROTEIN: hypothetical protein PHMEG_00016354 [Phytophthora megakarya]|uniref:Uncharacterized protein n=1 Tax=Phytophthora megakarya TaxID=4795 RepID=A0A225W0P5_9STRA|nr:LOW QUALITY PROTEIN: hypothetical protein PHMEG_00016354 [Phytophthora megakarya]